MSRATTSPSGSGSSQTPDLRLVFRGSTTMSVLWLICLGLASGAGAGLLAGLIGIGGGIVIVPVMYYGLLGAGASADQAAHIAIATSLAAILPAALASSISHGGPATPISPFCANGVPELPSASWRHSLSRRICA